MGLLRQSFEPSVDTRDSDGDLKPDCELVIMGRHPTLVFQRLTILLDHIAPLMDLSIKPRRPSASMTMGFTVTGLVIFDRDLTGIPRRCK